MKSLARLAHSADLPAAKRCCFGLLYGLVLWALGVQLVLPLPLAKLVGITRRNCTSPCRLFRRTLRRGLPDDGAVHHSRRCSTFGLCV